MLEKRSNAVCLDYKLKLEKCGIAGYSKFVKI